MLLITCSNYELETGLRKPEIRFPKVKNMGSIGVAALAAMATATAAATMAMMATTVTMAAARASG